MRIKDYKEKCETCNKSLYYNTLGASLCINCTGYNECSNDFYFKNWDIAFENQKKRIQLYEQKIDSKYGKGTTLLYIGINRENFAKEIYDNPYNSLEYVNDWLKHSLFFIVLDSQIDINELSPGNIASNDPNLKMLNDSLDGLVELYKGKFLLNDKYSVWKPYLFQKNICILSPHRTGLYTYFLKKFIDEEGDITLKKFGIASGELFLFRLSQEDEKFRELLTTSSFSKAFKRGLWRFNDFSFSSDEIGYLNLIFDPVTKLLDDFPGDFRTTAFRNKNKLFPEEKALIEYLTNLMSNSKTGLFVFNIYDYGNAYIFGLYSLLIIKNILMSLQSTGQYRQRVGSTIEYATMYMMNGLDVSTTLPNGNKGINVKWPGRKGKELADILLHKREKIIIIELKHWYIVEESEFSEQLNKFKERIDWLKLNHKELGFNDESYDIIPIFYCPFPPYSDSNIDGIKIVNSHIELTEYLLIDKEIEYKQFNIKFLDISFEKNNIPTDIGRGYQLNEYLENNFTFTIPENSKIIVDIGQINKFDWDNSEIVIESIPENGYWIIPVDIPIELTDKVKNLNLEKNDTIVFICLEYKGNAIYLQDIRKK